MANQLSIGQLQQPWHQSDPASATPSRGFTVEEVIALLGAGAKVDDLHQIKRAVSLPPFVEPTQRRGDDWYVQMIQQRWQQTFAAQKDADISFKAPPILAVHHVEGQDVTIFVGFYDGASAVFRDPVATFPSDALIANMHLLREQK